nr:MAG TPA: hypothetical protein [Caudoviricetes sp.]
MSIVRPVILRIYWSFLMSAYLTVSGVLFIGFWLSFLPHTALKIVLPCNCATCY